MTTGKKHASGIIILNVFLGWTLLGWVAALVWAVSDVTVEKHESLEKVYRQGFQHIPILENDEILQEEKNQIVASDEVVSDLKEKAKPIQDLPVTDLFDKLKKLKDLLESGALTQDEFNIQKARLLN